MPPVLLKSFESPFLAIGYVHSERGTYGPVDRATQNVVW